MVSTSICLIQTIVIFTINRAKVFHCWPEKRTGHSVPENNRKKPNQPFNWIFLLLSIILYEMHSVMMVSDHIETTNQENCETSLEYRMDLLMSAKIWITTCWTLTTEQFSAITNQTNIIKTVKIMKECFSIYLFSISCSFCYCAHLNPLNSWKEVCK